MRTILPDPCYFILAEEESKGGIIGVSVVVLGEYFVPFINDYGGGPGALAG